LPREVFFFGFGFADDSLPAAAARAFCFFVATTPPIAVTATVLLRRRDLTVGERRPPCGCGNWSRSTTSVADPFSRSLE